MIQKTTKVCSTCKVEKPISDFYKNKRNKDGYHSQCKSCMKEYFGTDKYKIVHRAAIQKYKKSEKGKKNKSSRKYWDKQKRRECELRVRYGLTKEDYDIMLKNQNGVCAICGLPETKKNFSVDHNHNTDKVRGLLCQKCNRAIGLLNVDTFGILNLMKAIEYIKGGD